MQKEDPKAVDPDRVSTILERSLRRCSGMVRDYRSRLIETNFKGPEFMLVAEAEGEDGTAANPPNEET
jgi:hypothetical protein